MVRKSPKRKARGLQRRIASAPPKTSPMSDSKLLTCKETPVDVDPDPDPDVDPDEFVAPAGTAVVVRAPAETAAENTGGLVELLFVSM